MLPDVGDIAWVELDPVMGSEQAGRRPALILSGAIYHEESSRAVICPITSVARPWPFNVALPDGIRTKGVVLVDQVRMIDRQQRMFDIVERVPADVVAEVKGRLAALLGLDAVPSIAKTNEPS